MACRNRFERRCAPARRASTAGREPQTGGRAEPGSAASARRGWGAYSELLESDEGPDGQRFAPLGWSQSGLDGRGVGVMAPALVVVNPVAADGRAVALWR